MPIFTYTVKDQEGKTLTGTVEALDLNTVREILREKRYVTISLSEKKEEGFSAFLKRLRGVSAEERVIFARQLATMISSGLPLGVSLETLRAQARSPRMQEVLTGMIGDIQAGSSLSKSMGKYPDAFSRIFITLVEAGEASGKLEELLEELANKMEKDRTFQGKLRGALIYPAIIFLALGAVFVIMIFVVVPTFTELYSGIGATLPLPTRLLIALSNLLRKGWWFLLILAGVGGYASRQFMTSSYGRYKMSEIAFKIPVFGKLGKEAELARFSRTLGLLIGAGIPITQALEIVAGGMGNVLYHDAILAAAKQVEKGIPLSTPLAKDPNFPPLLSQMLTVGEETGKMDEVLNKAASFFESQAEQGVANLSSALEPIIMVVLGVMVGFLVLSIISPIYQLITQF